MTKVLIDNMSTQSLSGDIDVINTLVADSLSLSVRYSTGSLSRSRGRVPMNWQALLWTKQYHMSPRHSAVPVSEIKTNGGYPWFPLAVTLRRGGLILRTLEIQE